MLSETLEQVRNRSRVRSEAYRLRLVGPLWWANVIFMALPASFATAAAVCAAGTYKNLGAWLAGAAAVLTVVHKTLKCDEYQAECLRLNQRYQSIATLADAVLANDADSDPDLPAPQKLIVTFAELEESAMALLTERDIRAAVKAIRNQEDRDRGRASDDEPPRLKRTAIP
jgi:hypothetical protein